MHRRICVLTTLVLVLASSCEVVAALPKEEPLGRSAEPLYPRPSREAQRCLLIVEDPRRELQERIRAVRELGKRREEATVDRLVLLLPGEYDALTREVIVALAMVRSRRALPALWRMWNEQNVNVPGKIRASLHYAIGACGGGDPDGRYSISGK
jgi:hypothetical protein